MSRSFRKNVFATDGQKRSKSRKWRKKHSNQKLRRKLKKTNYKISNGKAYKNGHSSNSWDICDWRWRIDKPIEDRFLFGFLFQTKEEQEENYRKVRNK